MSDVVILDDDALVLDTLIEALRDVGLDVSEALEPEQALAWFANTPPPRVLVADLDLGHRRDGRDVAREARRIVPELAVIFITAHPDRLGGEILDDRHVVLPKPFLPAELIATIRRLASTG